MSKNSASILFASTVTLVSSILYFRKKGSFVTKDVKEPYVEPKITIDTVDVEPNSTYSYLLDEVREGSITPTTFDRREYPAIDSPVFTEIYSHSGNSVTRFGINTRAISFDSSLIKFPSLALTGEEAEAKGEAESGVAFTRSSKSSTKKFIKAQVEKILHTNIEINALNKALNYLLSDDAPKVVLVDVIARNGLSLKTIPGTALHETHCVVLCRNPSNAVDGKVEIVVIDPSNSAYSWHLENEDAFNALGPEIAGKISYIRTQHKSWQIYKAEGVKRGDPVEIGPGPTDFRDCIDIAVKIAFGLNVIDPAKAIDIDKIQQHPVIIALSNNKDIDLDFAVSKGSSVRLKQTSDTEIVRKFMVVKAIARKFTDASDSLLPGTREELDLKYAELLDKARKPSDLGILSTFCFSVSEQLKETVGKNEEELTKILGEFGGEDGSI